MATQRFKDLLYRSALELEMGNMLLNGAFLQENEIYADEALGLAQTVATLLRGYLRLDPEVQAMVLLLGADTDQQIPTWLAFQNTYHMRAVRRMKSGEDAEENFFGREK